MRVQGLVEEAARHLKSLERMRGVLVGIRDEQGVLRTYLYSKVQRGDVLDSELVKLLLGTNGPESFWHIDAKLWMERALHAQQVLKLDAGRLGKWSYQLACIEKWPDLEKVIQSGEGALKAWRGQDMSTRYEEMVFLYNKLNQCYQAAHIPGGEHVLPFLLYVFEAVEEEDRGALKDAVVEAQALITSGVLTEERLVNAIEALAGYCHLGSVGVSSEAYQVGAVVESRAQLLALSQLGLTWQNLEVMKSIGGSEEVRRWSYLSIWRVAAVLGVEDAWRLIHYALEPLRVELSEHASLEEVGERFLAGCRALDMDAEWTSVWSWGDGGDVRGKRLVYQLASVLRGELSRWKDELGSGAELNVPSCGAFWRLVSEQGDVDALGCELIGAIMWEEVRRLWSEQDDELVRARCEASASLVVGVQGIRVSGLSSLGARAVEVTRQIVNKVGVKRVNTFWPQIKRVVLTMYWGDLSTLLMGEHLTSDELGVIFEHKFLRENVKMIPHGAKQRRRVLDSITTLDRAGVLDRLDLENGWLIRLCGNANVEQDYQIIVVIKSLSDKLGTDGLSEYLSILYDTTGVESSMVGRAFARWMNDTGVMQSARIDNAVKMLGGGDDVKLLVSRYFYHQELLGESVGLSKNILKVVGSREGSIAGQIKVLEAKLEGSLLKLEQEDRLRRRLAKLRQGESKGAWEGRLRRGRNLLESSLAGVMERSLAHVMDEAWLAVLEGITGRRYDRSILSKELRLLLLVSQGEDFDSRLFSLFLSVALGQRELLDIPENSAWVTQSRLSKDVLAYWLGGFHDRVPFGDGELEVYTESNLLMAAHMGTLFGTCLSLDHGDYAMSALRHNLEVNKHVVFVKDGEGKVIARKLIAIEKERGTLIGYPLYVTDCPWDSSELTPLIEHVIVRFAHRCGLVMGDSGEPKYLLSVDRENGSFYLDGVESWGEAVGSVEFPVSDDPCWPARLDAQMEWAYWVASEQRDWGLLRALAWRRRDPWSRYALVQLCAGGKEQLKGVEPVLKKYGYYEELRGAMLNSPGFSPSERIAWFVDVFSAGRDRWEGISELMVAVALDVRQIRELGVHLSSFIHELDASESLDAYTEYSPPLRLSVVCGELEFGVLLSVLQRMLAHGERVSGSSIYYQREVQSLLPSMLQMLRLSWVRHGAEVNLLSEALLHEKVPHMLEVLLGLAREVRHVKVGQALWTRWLTRKMSFFSKRVQEAMLWALAGQDLEDEQRVQFLDMAKYVFGGHDLATFHAMLQGEATVDVEFRKARRDVVRVIERTRQECREKGMNQIRYPDVFDAFKHMAALEHDELESVFETLAKACWIETIQDHREALSMLARSVPLLEDEMWALETMLTIYHGDREVVQARIERYFGDGKAAHHFYWWVLLKDRADELTDETKYMLARDCALGFRYVPIVRAEEVLFWLSRCNDWKGMTMRCLAEFEKNGSLNGGLAERGADLASLFLRGDERLTWIAHHFLIALARGGKVYELLVFYDFLTLMAASGRDDFDRCAQDMLAVILDRFGAQDSAVFDVFEELCFATHSWEQCLSTSTIRQLLKEVPDCTPDMLWSEFKGKLHERAKTNKRGKELVKLL